MSVTSVGDISLGLNLDQRGFASQLSGISAIANRAGKKIGAALAAGFAVKGVADFSKQCLELGSNLTEVQNVVDVTFGSMSGQVDKFAQNAAGAFGLSETMAKQFMGTFGAMSSAFGFSTKESYKMSEALTGLAGDVASFYNMDQGEAFTKLKSVFTGETETLKDLGVVMTQSALDQYALANGYGRTTSAMTEQEKVALRYQFVMAQLKLAQGDFSRTQDQWANQTRLLSLQIDSLKAAIGQGLIAVLTPAIQVLNAFLSRLVSAANAFKNFIAAFTGHGVAEEAKGIAQGLDSVGASASSAGMGAGSIGRAAGKAAKAVKRLKREMMGFDKMNKLSPKENSGSGAGTSGGGGTGGASGIGGGVSAGSAISAKDEKKALKLGKGYEALSKSIKNLKNAFKLLAGVIGVGLKAVWDEVLKPFGKWVLQKIAPSFINILAGAFKIIAAVLKGFAPIAKTAWKVFFKPLAKFAGKVIAKALELVASAVNKLGDWMNKHTKVVTGFLAALMGFLLVKRVAKEARALKAVLSGIPTVLQKGTLAFKLQTATLKAATVAEKAKAIATKIGTKATKAAAAAQRIMNLVMSANPIGLIIAAVGLLVAAFVVLWKKSDKFRAFWKKLWSGVKKHCASQIKAIKAAIIIIKTVLAKVIKAAAKLLKPAVKFLKNKLQKRIEAVKKTVELFKKAWNGIKTKSVELKAKIAEGAGNIADKAGELWGDFKDASVELAVNVVEKGQETLASLKEKWESIKDRSVEFGAKVATKWSDIKTAWENVSGPIKDKLASMRATVATKWNDIKKYWHYISDNIKNKTASMRAKIASKWSDLRSRWNSLLGKFKDKTVSIGLKFSAAAADLKSWINRNVIDRVNSKFKNVPILKNHLIPHLAEGGFVKPNTPQLAMIGDNRHQGEVVSPENKLKEMALWAANNSSSDNSAQVVELLRMILSAIKSVDGNAYLDGRKITDEVIKRINARTRASGICPIKV